LSGQSKSGVGGTNGLSFEFTLTLDVCMLSMLHVPLFRCFRYVDDNLSDVLLENDIPAGSNLVMDYELDTGSVTVTHSLESITVTGHSSGFNGEIVVVQDMPGDKISNMVKDRVSAQRSDRS
jgi:hypothetical protein